MERTYFGGLAKGSFVSKASQVSSNRADSESNQMYFATCFDVLKDKFVSLNASLFVLVLLSASLVLMANNRVEQPSGRPGRTK